PLRRDLARTGRAPDTRAWRSPQRLGSTCTPLDVERRFYRHRRGSPIARWTADVQVILATRLQHFVLQRGPVAGCEVLRRHAERLALAARLLWRIARAGS